MDELIEKLYISTINPSGASLIKGALNQKNSTTTFKWNELLSTQRLPFEGWADASIEGFLLEVSAMDANNFGGVVGMGEREGRVHNNLIKNRHFGFAHGMGRSGNLKDAQPKAIGSTFLSHLTHKLAISALRSWGFGKKILAGGVNIMPVCTGMSLMLSLMAVKSTHRKVIWLRIDQKSCLKSVLAGNFEIVVIEGRIEGDEIVTDLDSIEQAIKESNGQIHSIISCVSCFAPRAPDSIVQISLLAEKYSIAHIVNAAYGGTSARACNLLNAAADCGGRIDAVVMSLDKNFMVPVGGAIVFGPQSEMIERIASRYAGRAGISHLIDLFVTLVGQGQKGISALKEDRLKCFEVFKTELSLLNGGIKLMNTPHNDISFALKLPEEMSTSIGSQLFHRNISGARVIQISQKLTTIEGVEFINFGSHSSKWPGEFCYLNVAAAVGSKVEDIEIFIKKLTKLK